MSLRILIAEDAADVAEVVAFGARMNWPDCEVVVATDGAEAVACFDEHSADLAILDISMPPPDGFEVCRHIREKSQIPILMLSVKDGTLDKVRALDLGADDYLTKPFDHLELLARMRALVRRSSQQTEQQEAELTVGELHIDFANREVWVGGEMVKLTSTEYRLLGELARHAGTVLTHEFLLERVWGPEYVRETHYLKVYIRRLRKKLGDDAERPRYIETEWGTGYRFILPL